MGNDIQELIVLIKDGKLKEYTRENIEFKAIWKKEYGRKISALANSIQQNGAHLLIGVDDNGNICGKDEKWAKNQEEVLSQQVNQLLTPSQTVVLIKPLRTETGWVICVEIRPPGTVVYWENRAYKAAGTTTQEMEPAEIMGLLISLPGLTDFSAQKLKGEDEYDPELVLNFAKIVNEKRKKNINFDNLHNLPPENVLNVLGIKDRNVTKILFGDLEFRIIYYNSSEEIIDNLSFQGMFRLLSKDFILNILRWAKKEQDTKGDTFSNISEDPYSFKALREVLANAVAHAVYFEKSGDIIVEVYTDRLVISNICLPESSYFANKWFSKAHHSINNLLMETLRLAGFVDELGQGKKVIFSESISYGRKPPIVNIEEVGLHNRWRLCLFGGKRDEIQMKILERIREKYRDRHKAMVANALVLWRNQTVSSIKKYIDGESLPVFKEVLEDLSGPIFYYEPMDKIVLRRWVRVLVEEGKDAKKFTLPEEEDLRKHAYNVHTQYKKRMISPKELRKLAGLGKTDSEKVLVSRLLSKWVKEGHLKKIKYGLYEFKEPERFVENSLAKRLGDLIVGETQKHTKNDNSGMVLGKRI